MIENLTKKQEEAMIRVRDEWLDMFFSGKEIDKPKAKELIEWLYEFSGLSKPDVLFVESPLAAQYAINMISEVHRDQVRGQVWDQVWGQVWGHVGGQVSDHVWDQVRDQVRGQVWGQVRDHVRDHVRDQVGDQVGGKKLNYFSFSSYGNVSDYGWLSFYSFFEEEFGINNTNKAFKAFRELIRTGIYDMVQLDGLCVACSLPMRVERNTEKRMHSVSGPAIEWKDGYKLYYLNGIHFPEDMFLKLTSGEMSFADILAIQDVDQRNQAMRFVGKEEREKFLHHVSAQLMDTHQKTSINGNEIYYKLWKLPKGSIFQRDTYAMQYNCPSTGMDNFSGVPEMRTCAEAMAWKMSNDKNIITPEEWQELIPLKDEA